MPGKIVIGDSELGNRFSPETISFEIVLVGIIEISMFLQESLIMIMEKL